MEKREWEWEGERERERERGRRRRESEMGLSKYGYKYLLTGVVSIVTLIIAVITKSHDPLSRP